MVQSNARQNQCTNLPEEKTKRDINNEARMKSGVAMGNTLVAILDRDRDRHVRPDLIARGSPPRTREHICIITQLLQLHLLRHLDLKMRRPISYPIELPRWMQGHNVRCVPDNTSYRSLIFVIERIADGQGPSA